MGLSIDFDGDQVKYDVYLDKNYPPTTKRTSSPQTDVFFALSPLSLDASETYYWKIVAIDGNDGETGSEVRSFTTQAGLSKLVLSYPTDGQERILPFVWDSSSSKFVKNMFSWTMSTGGTGDIKYTIMIDLDEAFSEAQFFFKKVEEIAGGTILMGSEPGESKIVAGKTYYWKVIAEDANGQKKESEVWDFKTDYYVEEG